jgi:hypothetical protein
MKMKITLLASFFLLINFSSKAQMSKWIIGGGQADTFLNWNNYGTNNLKFFQINFNGTSPSATQRNTGNSINSIQSYGTMDPSVCYFDKNGNLKFYVFSASQTLANGNFNTAPGDSFFIAEFNTQTNADEVTAKFATEQFGGSVVDMEIVRKNCSSNIEEPSPDEYYIFYKTRAASGVNDEIRYVIYNYTSKTLTAPSIIVNNIFTGEGMGISPKNNLQKHYFIFTTLDTIANNFNIWECSITSSNVSAPILLDSRHYSTPVFNVIPCAIEFTNSGNKLAIGSFNPNAAIDDIIVYDFDLQTGVVSNAKTINNILGETGALEFSNDGTKLYAMQMTSHFNSPFLYYIDVPIKDTILDFSPYIDLTPYLNYGGFHIQKAFDKKLYVNPGYGSKTLIQISNIDSLNPILNTLGNSFFGVNNWAGTDLPEQIDGMDYSSNNCYPLGVNYLNNENCSLNRANYTNQKLFVADLNSFKECGEIYSIQLYDFIGRLLLTETSCSKIDMELEKIENKNLVYSITYKSKSQNAIQIVSGKLFLSQN